MSTSLYKCFGFFHRHLIQSKATKSILVYGAMLIMFLVPRSVMAQPPTVVTVTASGSFTVPAGVTSVTVYAWGGGGAGGGGSTASSPNEFINSGGGGGGACSSNNIVTVSGGQTYTITIGAGGTGTAANGGNGATTTFTGIGGTVSAAGGIGALGQTNNATGATSSGGIGGTTGSTVGGGVIYAGGAGNTGYNGTTTANGYTGSGGGGGGSGGIGTSPASGSCVALIPGGTGTYPGGNGGYNTNCGTSTSSSGIAGAIFGGGGSGDNNYALANALGGNGGAGRVVITYILPDCVAPSAQPTSLVSSAVTLSSFTASFTAASPAPSGYLVVRYPSGSAVTLPASYTTYTVGNTLGLGTVVSVGTATTFNNTGLSGGAAYDFYVYSYAAGTATTCTGNIYQTISPLTATLSTNSCSAITGTVPIGPGQTYTTLTAAMTYISANGISGNTILELQSNYVSTSETFPITFPANSCINASKTLTIRPAAGATGLSIVNTATLFPTAATIFDFNGCSYVTIDGRPGGTGTATYGTSGITGVLTIGNIYTSAASTIRFINDATFNTVKFCDIQGSSTTTTAGVIFIGATTGTIGNDNNNILNNNIHASGANLPLTGIMATGSTTYTTDNILIDKNNIYDYSTASTNGAAGLVINTGNSAFTVTNNSFYSTATRAINFASAWRGISSSATLTGFNISNNYIGGTTFACGGTPLTFTSTSTFRMAGIDVTFGNSANTIGSNTIQNILITTAYASGSPGAFVGIWLNGGYAAITNNTIGGSTTDNIRVIPTASTAGMQGISIASGVTGITLPVTGNTINNLSIYTTTNTALYNSISGIAATGTPNALQIGGSTTALGNTISNLKTGTTGSVGTTTTAIAAGINVSGAALNVLVQNNSIHDITNYHPQVGTGITAAVQGILLSSTSITNPTVSNNTMYNLNSLATAATAINVDGITLNLSTTGTATVNANFIHSLGIPNSTVTAANPLVIGLYLLSGAATVTNNMVRLGIDGTTGASTTVPVGFIGIRKVATQSANIWFNSVYIGGSGVANNTAGNGNSFALYRPGAGAADDFRDNILVNVRANASSASGSKHWCIYLTSIATLTLNSNVYQTNATTGTSTGNYFGETLGTTDYTSYSASWGGTTDNSSLPGDPMFIAPTGTAATVNLHIQPSPATTPAEGTGIAISAVTLDIDGQARLGLTPTDIGADAGNFTSTVAACSTITITAGNAIASGINACSANLGLTGNTTTLTTGLSYQWQSSVSGSGSWSNVSGGTIGSSPWILNGAPLLAVSTDFQCIVSCAGGGTYTSVPVTVAANAGFAGGYTPIACTGFNKDVVAEGICAPGSLTSMHVSGDVDAVGYFFYDQTYTCPTCTGTGVRQGAGLPSNGQIISGDLTGLLYQLQPSSANNSLVIPQTPTTGGANAGTLTLTSPTSTSSIYVLATSGSGTATMSVTVNFNDTIGSQTYTGKTVQDWFNGGNTPLAFAEGGFGRITTAGAFSGTGCTTSYPAQPNGSNGVSGTSACLNGTPDLYDIQFLLDPSFFNKHVSSITFTNTSGGATAGNNVLNVFAVSAAVPTPASFCGGLATSVTLFPISVSGVSYQWNYSSSTGGPYTALVNGTSQGVGNPSNVTTTTLTNTYSGSIYYQCQATCTVSGVKSFSNEVNINISGQPTVVAGGGGTYCSGGGATGLTLNTTGSTANTYTWAPATGLNVNSGASVQASPSTTTTYTVTGYINACSATATVNVSVAAAPAITAISASPTALCAGGTSNLSVTAAGSPTYSWSPAGTLTGATTATPTATPAAGITTYTVSVTSGTCTTTATVAVSELPFAASPTAVAVTASPYLASTATLPQNDDILNVTLGSLNNSSACGTLAPGAGSVASQYSNYTTGVAIPTITAGSATSYSVKVGYCTGTTPATSFSVYIDYNNNGVFTDPGENVANQANLTAVLGGTVYSGTITIPTTAFNGLTRMRIVNTEGNINPVPSTGSYSYGETEDYLINITGAVNPCGGTSFTLSPNLSGGGAGPYTYSWSSSPAGLSSTTATNTVMPSTNTTYSVTVTDNCGTSVTAATTVNVTNTTALVVSPVSSLECGNAAVNVSVTSSTTGYTYSWGPASGLYTNSGATTAYTAGSNATSLYAFPTSASLYTVSATQTASGCVSTQSVKIYPVNTMQTFVNPTSCAPTSGQIVITPLTGTVSSTVYQSNFSSGNAGIATIGATSPNSTYASIVSNQLQLTPDVGSQYGYLSIPQSYNTNTFHTEFYYTSASSAFTYADGMSYSFGTDVQPATGQWENGWGGYGLKVCFDDYSSGTASGWQSGGYNYSGVYIVYGNGFTSPASTGLVTYNSSVAFEGTTHSKVTIDVNSSGQLTLTIGGTTVISNQQLPAAWLTDNKSSWIHNFAARCGGSSASHIIDGVLITEGLPAFTPQYGYNNSNWQSAPTFTGLGAGTYNVQISDVANPSCIVSLGTDVLTVPALVSVPTAIATASATYPASNATSTADDEIFNVTFGSLNNTSTCSTVAPGTGSIAAEYSNYTSGTGAPAAPVITAGAATPYSVTVGYCSGTAYSTGFSIYIDYNHNGVFTDPGEYVGGQYSITGAVGGTAYPGSITVPTSALNGITRMRVVLDEFSTGQIASDITYNWGETEDYNINITGGANPNCGGVSSFLIAANASGGSSVYTYSWASSPSGFTSTAASATVSPLVSTTYTVTVTDNCANSVVQSVAVTVLPSPTVTVTPASLIYCSNATVPVNMTASGASTYVWSPSTGLSTTSGATVGASPTVSTTYTVTGTASNGCYGTASAVVNVKTPPILSTPTASLSTVCSGSPTVLSIVASHPPISYCVPANTLSSHTIANLLIQNPASVTQISQPTPPSGTNYYQDYGTTTGGTGAFVTGTTYTVTGVDNGGNANIFGGFGVWIDLNQDGVFDNTEFIAGQGNSAATTYTFSQTFTVPSTAFNGTTKMRVRSDWSETHSPGIAGSVWACNTGNGGYGVTEDYTITITGATNPPSSGFSYAWSPNATVATPTTASTSASPVATTAYTVSVTDMVTGCSLNSAPVTITVSLPSVTINTPAAACSPSTVDLTAPAVTAGSTAGAGSTGGLTFTYWTNAAATIAYSTPTVATAGTYYIKGTNSLGCFDIKPVTVTVNPTPTVVITNPATVCLPSTADLTAAAVTAGSTSGLTFTYWTDAAATISYTTPTAASAGTYYIKGTTALGCYNIQPVTVTSTSPPAATASSAGTYIPGQTINLVSGPSGQTSYAWSGPSAFTASSQNVSRTNATSTMSGTYTVTVTNSSGCSATASTVVVVNGLGDYTWTGATNTNWATVTNWTPTAPVGGPSGCSQNVIIPVVTNYPVISTATSIARITMNSGAQLTLNANLSVCQTFVGGTTSAATIIGTGHLVMAGTGAQTMSGLCNVDYLEINHTSTGLVSTATFNINKAMIMTKGAFSNNGSITLVSNASGDAYLDNFTSTTAGSMSNSLSVQRYIGNVADGYRDLSSPVATSVNDLNTAFPVFGQDNVDCWYAYSPYPNVQIFKEPLIIATGNFYEHWLSYTSLTKPLTAMIGYSARTYKGTPFTITFKGSAYNGAKSISITHTTSATPTSDGWNLLGNPYPSPIQWSLVKAMNGAVANGSYYVYHTTGEFTGNWGSYNGTTGVNGVTDLIAIGQGFFIQTATSGTFTMNNTVRTTGSASFYRTRALDNEIRLTLSKGVNSDEIVTYTEPGATAGFDADLDAQKIAAGSAVSIGYSLSGRDYAINAMDVITEQTVLPLTISGKETGSYTLTATTINVPGLTAYLLDSKTGSLTDLSTTASVQLSLTGGQTYAGRYSVVFQSNSASTGITATEASKTHIYAYGNQVHVIRSSANPATISVTNLLGQEIKEIPTNTEKTVFELPAVQPWYAIIKVTEGDKTTVSKVIISNN